MSNKKVLRRGNLRVELDKAQVIPDDPGDGTPAMVFNGEYGATYWCAVGEGVLINERTGQERPLTDKQMEWLDSIDAQINDFLYK